MAGLAPPLDPPLEGWAISKERSSKGRSFHAELLMDPQPKRPFAA